MGEKTRYQLSSGAAMVSWRNTAGRGASRWTKAEKAIKATRGRISMQSTFETKLKLTAQESDILLEQAKQMCRIERQLFVRLYVKKEEVDQVKRDTLAYDQITGRQYNSVLYSLKGRIGNIEENHKFQIQQLSGQVIINSLLSAQKMKLLAINLLN